MYGAVLEASLARGEAAAFVPLEDLGDSQSALGSLRRLGPPFS